MESKKFSVGVIVLFCFICYPIAIFMIVANVLRSSAAQEKNSQAAQYTRPGEKPVAPPKRKTFTALRVFGVILLFLGVIAVVSLVISEANIGGTVAAFIIFFVGGGTLMVLGQLFAQKDKRNRAYVQIINNTSDLSLAAIGKKVGRSEKNVLKDLREMLREGFFPNCSIDPIEMEFCFPRVADAHKYNYQAVVKVCTGCGAKNTVLAGTIHKCDYCNSPIEAAVPPIAQVPAPKPTLADSARSVASSAAGAVERLFDKFK